jgi:hypothetical protein
VSHMLCGDCGMRVGAGAHRSWCHKFTSESPVSADAGAVVVSDVSSILFAVVDAVLREKEAKARRTCGVSAMAEIRWMVRRRNIGWWRSCWPL